MYWKTLFLFAILSGLAVGCVRDVNSPSSVPQQPSATPTEQPKPTEDEVALVERKGFVRRSLGCRILRTDTATIALIAQFMGKD